MRAALITLMALGALMALGPIVYADFLDGGAPGASLQTNADAGPGKSATVSAGDGASTAGAVAGQDPVSDVVQVVEDIRSGNWRMVAAGVLSLIMFGLMRIRDEIGWFGTDRGAAVLVMLLSLSGGLFTSLTAGLPINMMFFVAAVGTALMSAGGYHWVRTVFWPKDKQPV